ncbi:MAG: PAS domain S-box protein [Marinilabiliales bacterium]|nr:MAG: PAS domain S-box protein [Marinilabiliales bacterium]
MVPEQSNKIAEALRRWSLLSSVIILFVALAVAAGWIADVMLLRSLHPEWVSMKFNTALGFVLTGSALVVYHSAGMNRRHLVASALAGLVLLLSFATLLQYILDVNLGIDELFISDDAEAIRTHSPGRMALSSSIGFVVASTGSLFIVSGRKMLLSVSQGLGVVLVVFFMIPLLGYLYGISGLYGYADFTSVAFLTAILFIILGMALLFAHPGHGMISYLSWDTPGGYIARRLVPLSLLLPVAFVWVLIMIHRQGWLTVFSDFHLATVMLIIVFLLLTSRFLYYINLLDKRRSEALEETHIANQHIISHVENSPLAVIEWDNEFRIRRWTKRAEILFGWEAEEVMKLLPEEWNFVPDEDRESVNEVMRRLMKGEETSTVSSNRNYTSDGRVLHCVWYNSALHGRDGRLISILSLVNDVTVEKEKEEKLRQNEFLLRMAGDLAHMGGWTVNLEQNRVVWSDQVARIHEMPPGYSPTVEEGIGFYAPGFRERVNQVFSKCTEEGIPYDEEMQIIAGSGRRVWVRTFGVAERDEQGKIVSVTGGFQDITEKKIREEEIRRLNDELEERVMQRTRQLAGINRELEAFAYSVSHDLKAPLRAMKGFAGILSDDFGNRLDDEGKRICSVIRDNTRIMGRLIDGLLAFSKLSSREMMFAEVDMTSLVRSVYHEVTTPHDRERIKFTGEKLCNVKGDAMMIKQLWANLISNAVKFTATVSEPEIIISCSTEQKLRRFRIVDNGVGFDMKYVDKIFGVFRRLHSDREFEGTGVGLAIVQRIVHRHGGTIRAEGKPGKGAEFVFTIQTT